MKTYPFSLFAVLVVSGVRISAMDGQQEPFDALSNLTSQFANATMHDDPVSKKEQLLKRFKKLSRECEKIQRSLGKKESGINRHHNREALSIEIQQKIAEFKHLRDLIQIISVQSQRACSAKINVLEQLLSETLKKN